MSKIVSVIIPAYNVDKYIMKCLDSVISQTYKGLEIIVVNDGSTDNTLEIIKTFEADSRLKVISQKNAGVTAARNAGIEASSGEYTAFVDSDDFLESDMYEKLCAALETADADVAVCDYNLVYDGRVDCKYSGMRDETVNLNNTAYYFFKYCACPKPNNYIWTRLYKSDIIKNSGVRFEQYKLGDDTLFNFKLLPQIKRAAHIKDALYNYLQRSDSNIYTVAKKGNLASVYADTFDSLANHYKENGYSSFLDILTIHAYTRLRSVIFYSKLAGMVEYDIIKSIADGWKDREISYYLRDTSKIDMYAEINGFSKEKAEDIREIMRIASDNPAALAGKVVE